MKTVNRVRSSSQLIKVTQRHTTSARISIVLSCLLQDVCLKVIEFIKLLLLADIKPRTTGFKKKITVVRAKVRGGNSVSYLDKVVLALFDFQMN